MKHQMSLSARREMLASVYGRYQEADWPAKGRILDGFVAATGYDRKYAIQLLNGQTCLPHSGVVKPRPGRQIYDAQFLKVLVYIWHTANQVCSKRLVPFIPELVSAMERHGHLRITEDLRRKLLSVSAATVDRLLHSERERTKDGQSLTKRGTLLKNQVAIRTFADWDEAIPGFFEIDLVAHCGGDPNGAFLNTLVLIDIATGWLECMPLLKKSAADVISGIEVARTLMPFNLKGLDSDCGSEFINHDLLDYCEANEITFTRARTHRKNDQAFVEEKNGSVVRRLVGYDRFTGSKAWTALAQFYGVLRLYVNYFQPSLKLLSKQRDGARVSKQYHPAQTAYQRLLQRPDVSESTKAQLTNELHTLDPVNLMDELRTLQIQLWRYAGQTAGTNQPDTNSISINGHEYCQHYQVHKPLDRRKGPRTWRTRPDPFDGVWPDIQFRLEIQPHSTARDIIEWLGVQYPDRFSAGQIRTLQRRISNWKLHSRDYETKMEKLMSS